MKTDKNHKTYNIGKFMTYAIKAMVIFLMGTLAYWIVELGVIRILIGN